MKAFRFLALLCISAFSIQQVTCDSYDSELGKQLFFYSAAAYCEAFTLLAWACGVACENIKGIESITMITDIIESVQGYVAYNSQTQSVYVIFRGSIDTINIIEDVDLFQMQYPNGPEGAMVHTGFYETYSSVSEQVIAAVNKTL